MLTVTLTADGDSAATSARSERFAMTAYSPTADWGSGTLVVECLPDGSEGDWIPVTGASWTADQTAMIDVSRHWQLRFSISGSTTPNVDCTLRSVAH